MPIDNFTAIFYNKRYKRMFDNLTGRNVLMYNGEVKKEPKENPSITVFAELGNIKCVNVKTEEYGLIEIINQIYRK